MRRILGYFEPWYLLIAGLGLVEGGINIILMPQYIASQLPQGTVLIGLMMGVWCLGGLMGPVLGRLVDRYGLPRWSLGGLLSVAALLQYLLLQTTSIVWWLLLMWGLGVTFFGGLTLFNLLIVRRFEEVQWHWRTSLMMGFFVGGEVLGFALAGEYALPGEGILHGSLVLLVSASLSFWLAPGIEPNSKCQHGAGRAARPLWTRLMGSTFFLFLLAWGWMNFSAQLLFLPFPVLFDQVFALAPADSARALSIGAGSSLIWYLVIGRLSERLGALRLLLLSAATRLLVFTALAWFAFRVPGPEVMLLLIVLYRQTWPFMLTSAQVAASQLAPDEIKGMAIGIFNAVTGIMNAASGLALSGITLVVGMHWMPMVATVGLAIGLALLGKVMSVGHEEACGRVDEQAQVRVRDARI